MSSLLGFDVIIGLVISVFSVVQSRIVSRQHAYVSLRSLFEQCSRVHARWHDSVLL